MIDVNKIKAATSTMTKLNVGGGRQDIVPGTYYMLINSVRLKTKQLKAEQFMSGSGTILHAVQDENGRKPGMEGYSGHLKGDNVSFAFFFGVNLEKDFGPFICASMGMSAEDAKKIKAEEIPEMVAAILSEEGSQPGILDNRVVIQVRAVRSAPQEYFDTKTGEKKVKVYINNRYDKRVLLKDIAALLDEPSTIRYFNSVERFKQLMQDEANEFATVAK